ncbi:MAG: dihydrofolate reductase [Peptococcaceae bacterium]|nr:dihydrofolate reductase [Peptococcaceae bacterium]
MNAIVSVDQNWGIGRQGNLLMRIPEDMAFFKAKTMGHVVIMGRETMLSLPRQEPLMGRVNLVLSRSLREEDVPGFRICRSLDDLFRVLAREREDQGYDRCDQECDKHRDYKHRENFVIGGEAVYKLLLPYCHRAYVTKIACAYQADRFFPNLDEDLSWSLCEEGDTRYYDTLAFRYSVYSKK